MTNSNHCLAWPKFQLPVITKSQIPHMATLITDFITMFWSQATKGRWTGICIFWLQIIDAAPIVCGAYVTVGRLSVCLSVPSIDSSNDGRRVCCCAPCGQEISIDSCGRRAARAPALSRKCGQRHVDSRRRRLNRFVLNASFESASVGKGK